ncbi:hypothetical protein JNM05_01070 [bacterium]|nr:hypothetical protein [bacterium]
MLQPKLLNHLLSVLNDNRIDYMITDSIVSSLQGEPRATHDVDIVVHLAQAAVPALLNAFPQPLYYLSEESIKEAIVHKSMFNLIDTQEGDKVDFWILTNDEFDQSRFERKLEEEVFGFKMKISQPEDTILAKLKWAKLSGGSEKQFTDALRVYEVQHGKLDLNYLKSWIAKLKLDDLWKQLESEARPIE